MQKEKKERKKSETEVEVDGTKELHVTLSPRTPGGDPPETEELIKALMVNVIFNAVNIIDDVTMRIKRLYLDNENLIHEAQSKFFKTLDSFRLSFHLN